MKVVGQDGAPDAYYPDFAPEPYVPPGVFPTPWEYVVVFLPDESIHGPRPAEGWPGFVATGFGGWASTLPGEKITNAPTDTARMLWLALEAGIAVVLYGLPGSDTERYAPGGDLYNDGEGDEAKGFVVLGKPIKGKGTFDLPGAQNPGLDHWADVGASEDGGLSYPNEDHPIMQRSAVLCAQYVNHRASTWGIDRRRLAFEGRSAGAACAQVPLLGPDRADPEMKDHRSESSRMPLGVLLAGSYWWPGFSVTSTAPGPAFPKVTDPDEVATNTSEAPAVYPREASGLRMGFKGYENDGPGVTGDELRAMNGRTAFFVLNTDQTLGLDTLTPTQALAFNGDDANNSRLPAMTDEIPGGIAHPAIMGPLLVSRLREVEVDGFHTANTVLVMRQQAHDELVGHTTDVGAPADALVTYIREDIEDEQGTIAPTLVAWLQQQFARISMELGIGGTPAGESQHERRRIRKAVVEALLGQTTAGDRVYPSRITPLAASKLPALCVYTDDEDWEKYDESPRRYLVAAELRVEVIVGASDGYDDQLDDLCLEVEAVLEREANQSEILGGVAADLYMKGTRPGVDASGDRITGARVLLLAAPYYVDAPREPAVENSLVSVQGSIETEGGAVVPVLATPDQGTEE